MASKIGYYKGEDPHGNTMYAYQRGPADPAIVGKVFGMKNVAEITKEEYEAGTAPEAPAAKPKTTKAEESIDLSKMKAPELREYGKKMGLDFPAVGMKKADMVEAIKTCEANGRKDDAAPEARHPEEMNDYGDEATDPPEGAEPDAGAEEQEK